MPHDLALHPIRSDYAPYFIVNAQGDQPASPVPHPKGVHLNLSNARPSGHTLAGVLQLLEPASTTAKYENDGTNPI
jgi:hypothetical protein